MSICAAFAVVTSEVAPHLRASISTSDLRSQCRHEPGREHLIEVIAILIQIFIVGILGVIAWFIQSTALKTPIRLARRNKLVVLEELQVL